MLLHIRPQLYSPFDVELVSLQSPQLGLTLHSRDLATRRPYPNKHYSVACRREGRKAIEGILIETSKFLEQFDLRAVWAVQAELLAKHTIHYQIIDRDFDAATDKSILWYQFVHWNPATGVTINIGTDRRPEWYRNAPQAQKWHTVMEVLPLEDRGPHIKDTVINGFIVAREETFAMPTIQREKLFDPRISEFRVDRRPTRASAFKVMNT
jgi:hypothetical protein